MESLDQWTVSCVECPDCGGGRLMIPKGYCKRCQGTGGVAKPQKKERK